MPRTQGSVVQAKAPKGLESPVSRMENRCCAMPVGSATCHCTTCHETFYSDTGFTKHRTRTFGCLTPAEMEAAGMRRNAKGHWVTSTSPQVQDSGGDDE